MSNPVDDALMAKEALFGGLWRGIKSQLTGRGGEALGGSLTSGALMASGGAAVAGVGAAASKIYDAITKKRDFKKMMNLNDDLKEEQAQDPKLFNASYNSLRRINPSFGKDPIVSGAYMRKMMANPDAAGLTIAQSVKTPTMGQFKPMALGTPSVDPFDVARQQHQRAMMPGQLEQQQLGLAKSRREEIAAQQKMSDFARQQSLFGKR